MGRRIRRLQISAAVVALLAAAVASPLRAEVDAEVLAAQASAALHRAVAFYREQVATEGSYLWKYSTDLTVRRGEGDATPSQGWVQPPGTPAIGLAYLDAWVATGDEYILAAAVETARALVRTQLVSGGWFHWIEFDPQARLAWCYRQPPSGCVENGEVALPESAKDAFHDNRDRDASTLDDAITQSALVLLIRVDEALGGADPAIREAADYGLARLLEAQYPNGAWPGRYDWKVPDALTAAAWRARYPASWSRTFVPYEEREVYHLNDHLMRNVIRVLLLADRVYGRPEHDAALRRAGEFLLAAQMPDPQPGWAQQYDRDLEPIWGRRFEPPALAAWETGSTIEALIELHLATGDQRYLEAAGRAAHWLERVRLADGRWARFYELETDRPLYMTKDYALTYDAADVPAHYGFVDSFGLPEVLAAYHRLERVGREAYLADAAALPDEAALAALAGAVAEEIAMQDEQGRWIDRDMIRSAAVIEHLGVLSRYVAAVRGRTLPALH
jgi:PelA/Pel-15E family pectate lyase